MSRRSARGRETPVGHVVFATRPCGYLVTMSEKLRLTIAYDEPDEDGWIVARVVEVPGAISQGRTPEEARENVIDALRVVLSPDDDDAAVAPGRRDELDLTLSG